MQFYGAATATAAATTTRATQAYATQRRPSAGSGVSSDACAQITWQLLLLSEKTLCEARKSITAFINHAIHVRNENEARTKKKMKCTRHEEKEQEKLKVVAAYEDEENCSNRQLRPISSNMQSAFATATTETGHITRI